jgi:hypothetical protein
MEEDEVGVCSGIFMQRYIYGVYVVQKMYDLGAEKRQKKKRDESLGEQVQLTKLISAIYSGNPLYMAQYVRTKLKSRKTPKFATDSEKTETVANFGVVCAYNM